MSTLASFSRLWDGTEQGWVVLEHTRDEAELRVVFGPSGPSISDIKAIRSLDSPLAKATANDALAQLKGLNWFSLGTHESAPAHRLRMRCESLGLKVEVRPVQQVQRSLINMMTKRFLLIEDDQVLETVVANALAHGLRIVHSIN